MNDFRATLEQANKAFRAAGTPPVSPRRGRLRRLARALEKNAERLAQAVADDLGKHEEEFRRDELRPVQEHIRALIRRLPFLARAHRRSDSPRFGEKLVPVPRGVVLIFGYWAEPVRSALEPLAAALAAGCRVVLRPAQKTPASAQILSEMLEETFPDGEVLLADRELADRELAEADFDLIVHTAAYAEAQAIQAAAAQRLTPVLLTPIGKNPVIVDASANLRYAARRIVRAKFRNAGQSPDAPDFVLAHARIRQKLVYEMSREVRALRGADPELSAEPFRVLNSGRFDALRTMLDRGRIACGGEFNRAKLYLAPTILDGITPDDPIMRAPVTGPILPVLEFRSVTDAAELLRRLPDAPMLSCFANRRVTRKLLATTCSTIAVVNDCVSRARCRYCGPGSDGRGVYSAGDAFLAFSLLHPVGRHARFRLLGKLAEWLEKFF